ncbi:hypothetical protein D3C80_485200 [compost metagenome]
MILPGRLLSAYLPIVISKSDTNKVATKSNGTDTEKCGEMFHEAMSKQQMASALESRFGRVTIADPKMISDIDASLGTLTRGHPINEGALLLFGIADVEHERGASLENAIKHAMELHPDVKPRRRRTKNIAGHTDPEHDKTILLAEYKRYRSRKAAGLDPTVSYTTNTFFEFILTQQWHKAAAVFSRANRERRLGLCSRLNLIGSKTQNSVTRLPVK